MVLYIAWYQQLFGPHNLVYHQSTRASGIRDLVFILLHGDAPALNMACITAMGLIAAAGLFSYQHITGNALLYILYYNLSLYIYPTLTAGEFLANQLLFFNIFLFTKPATRPWLRDAQYALHNSALAGIKIQVCLVYVLATCYKLCDAHWLQGSAVYQAMQLDAYTLPGLKSMPYWLFVCMDYATLAYQLLFAALVWIRPIKKWVLAVGVAQHLFIAFGVGLFSFGIIMIISYIIFSDFDRKL